LENLLLAFQRNQVHRLTVHHRDGRAAFCNGPKELEKPILKRKVWLCTSDDTRTNNEKTNCNQQDRECGDERTR
jgi:hypothetical protein